MIHTTIALAGTGIVVGTVGALLGVGGGIFLVPALTLAFDVPIHVAIGTSLVCVIGNSVGSAVAAPPARSANVELGLRLEVATVAGALAGGLVAGRVSSQALMILFGVVVFLTAAYMLKGVLAARRAGAAPEALFERDYEVRNWGFGLLGSASAGAVSGLLGVGGGFLKVPLMDAEMGVPLGIATATSNFMVGVTAAASVFVWGFGRGEVQPAVVVPAALGVFAGASLGTLILPRVRATWLRYALIALLVGIGIQMIARGLRG